MEDKITKEQFRKTAMSAIDSVVAVSDEIWATGLPTVVLRFSNNYEVVVGLRDAEETEVSQMIERYERALTTIADGRNFGSPLQAIAAKAIGIPPKFNPEEGE